MAGAGSVGVRELAARVPQGAGGQARDFGSCSARREKPLEASRQRTVPPRRLFWPLRVDRTAWGGGGGREAGEGRWWRVQGGSGGFRGEGLGLGCGQSR